MLARRLEPVGRSIARAAAREGTTTAAPTRLEGRWRSRGRVPTRGPQGPVAWYDRPAPDGDEDRWRALCRLQQRRLALGMSVSELARRTAAAGEPLRRETLSRVLNGQQPTTWPTVELLAFVLDIDLWELASR